MSTIQSRAAPVGPVAALAGAGARGVEVLRERRGEAVEGLPERLEPVAGDVVGGLGAVGEALDARERERHEVDGPGVETKDTRWPRDARRSASSRNGSRWPSASHGQSTTRSGRGEEDPASMARRQWTT